MRPERLGTDGAEGVPCPPAPELLLRPLQFPSSPPPPPHRPAPSCQVPSCGGLEKKTSNVTPVVLDPWEQGRDGSFILSSFGRILPTASPTSSQRPRPTSQGADWKEGLLVPRLPRPSPLQHHLLPIFWAGMQDKSIQGWQWQGLQ